MTPPDPECGNGVLEPGEQCDDGNLDDYDGCSERCRLETAFRIQTLSVRDPHFAIRDNVPLFGNPSGCADITDNPTQISVPLGSPIQVPAVNALLAEALQPDPNEGGAISLSLIVVSDAFSTSGTGIPASALTATCATTSSGCTDPVELASTTYDNGVCHTPIPNTMSTTWGASLNQPSVNCFQSAPKGITLSFSGIDLELLDAVVAGEWVGSPTSGIQKGVIRGFVTQASADSVNLLDSLGISDVSGTMRLSTLLPGGSNSSISMLGISKTFTPCQAANSSSPNWWKDTHNGQPGWWFYINYTANLLSDW